MESLYQKLFPNERLDGCGLFLEEVEKHLPEEGRILDLGCGDNTRLAAYRTARRQIWGADFQAHPHLEHAQWFRLLETSGKIPFPDATFAVVSACWVLEHVATPESFLTEVARVLKPGGKFVGLTVSKAHYMTWLMRLFHLLPHGVTQRLVAWLYGRRHHDTFPAFYRLNSSKSFDHASKSAGLQLENIRRIANQGYFSFCRLLQQGATVLDWLLEKTRPGLGRIYLIVTAEKPVAPAASRFAEAA